MSEESPFKPMAEKFTPNELANCAEREVKQRRRVYAHLVLIGSMTADFAARQIAMMQQIAEEYREIAEKGAIGRLL